MSMPRKISCAVEAVTDHGGRVYTVDLTPAIPAPPFRPGQFLHLTVDDYEPSSFWPESRVFSIASSPSQRHRIRICYSVKGRYTTKMEQVLRPGARVWIKLPYGDFVIGDTDEAVLLAGGTGISAFTAFLEGLKPQHPKAVWLVQGARDPSLLLFRDLLLGQFRQTPNLHLLFFTETGNDALERELAGLPRPPVCLPGRISLEAVWSHVAEPQNKVFYISGPPIMLSALSEQLKTRGLAPERIRTDAWE
jgi:ferredoxin-NADP reductase